MKKQLQCPVTMTGLAFFSMIFGAGNLLYPLKVGIISGDKNFLGIAGFLLTAVCLPLLSFIAIILFDGDYEKFFARLGTTTGKCLIFLCMIIIGPFIGIPRLITLTHSMIAPLMPFVVMQTITPPSSCLFSLIFLSFTFMFTYKERDIITLLGRFFSPALLLLLAFIIIKGLFGATSTAHTTLPSHLIFNENLIRGYETLDLFATLFFCSALLSILKKMYGPLLSPYAHRVVTTGLLGGFVGFLLLSFVYIGLSYLGAFYGQDLNHHAGGLFRTIAFRIIGAQGGFIIAALVLLACFSTAIALCAVITQYTQHTLFKNKIGYVPSLLIILVASIPLAISGLDRILALTDGPLTYIGSPVMITIIVCNIAYKLFGFKHIKIPALLIFLIALNGYIRM